MKKTVSDGMAVLRETPLTIQEATKRLPARNGKLLSRTTLFRWIRDGVTSPSGERVRLDGCRLGRTWMTSLEALERFMNALTKLD